MSRADGDISDSLAARLVKGLVALIVQPFEPEVNSILGLLSQKYRQRETSKHSSEGRQTTLFKIGQAENVAQVFHEAIMTLIGLPFQVFLNFNLYRRLY